MLNNTSIFSSMPGIKGMSQAQAENMKQMQETTTEQMDQALWAANQSLALTKLKVFNKMAKQVNEQQ